MTTRVNIHKSKDYDVYCGRGSKWGNPYTHIKDKETKAIFVVNTRTEAISKYKTYLLANEELLNSLDELKDKKLGCYCTLTKSCHCDVLIDLINETNTYSIF